MRLRLVMRFAKAPWWVQGLVLGAVFGAAMTLWSRLQSGHWIPAIIGGIAGGALFGVVMGRWMTRYNRRSLEGLDGLTDEEQTVVVRASASGPLPADPRLRESALGLAQRRRTEATQQRRWTIPILSVFSLLYVVLAVTQTAWWWLAVIGFGAVLVLAVIGPSRADKRMKVLQEPPADPL